MGGNKTTNLLIAVCFALVSLAGCASSADPDPDPAGSATASKTAEQIGQEQFEAAKKGIKPAKPWPWPTPAPSPDTHYPDQRGAIATGKYYLELIPYVSNTNNFTAFDTITVGIACEPCQELKKIVGEIWRAPNGWTYSYPSAVTDPKIVETANDPAAFVITYKVENKGEVNNLPETPAKLSVDEKLTVRVLLAWEEGRWKCYGHKVT